MSGVAGGERQTVCRNPIYRGAIRALKIIALTCK